MPRRLILSISFVVIAAIGAGVAIIGRYWPFSRESAALALSEALNSAVDFGTFQQTVFPYPGFLAANVKIIPKQGSAAGHAEIASLRAEATWGGLLSHRLRRLKADGLAISIRSLGEHVFLGNAGKTVIDELDLSRAILQIGPARDGQKFVFHRVSLQNVAAGRQMAYQTSVAIPRPAGELQLRGQLGPFKNGEFPRTPVAGAYQLSGANLGVFHGISGILSSHGKYSGVLSRLDFAGETDTPDFAVTESGHQHHLTTRFHAAVDGMNGDTVLPDLRATFDRTAIQVANAHIVSKGSDPAKTVSLEIVSGRGRIQDLMLLFIKGRQSPMLGPVGFRAHVVLPPGHRAFKQRVALDGDFGIEGAAFTKPRTQASAEELSERAEGESHDDPERVLTGLAGHVVLRGGTATFTNLSFRLPGATAHLSGTFSLVTEHVDLSGRLATEAKLSKTTTGIKSLFLKLLDPVFKGRRAGAVIPVSVDGTYDHPRFRELFTK